MNTQAVADILEARRLVLDGMDDTFGDTQAVKRLAEVREETQEHARDAVLKLNKTETEADVEAIVAVVQKLADEARAKLDALPPPAPQATRREQLIVAIQQYDEAVASIRAA